MTRTQLTRAVAGATGESPRTILALGFQVAPARPRATAAGAHRPRGRRAPGGGMARPGGVCRS